MEMMGLSEKSYQNSAFCSPPHLTLHIFCFLRSLFFLLRVASRLGPELNPSLEAAAPVSECTKAPPPPPPGPGRPLSLDSSLLEVTLPGQEQQSSLSFLPKVDAGVAAAAALFSLGQRACEEGPSRLRPSTLHPHARL